MQMSLRIPELKEYLRKQLELFTPDGKTSHYYNGKDIDLAISEAISRMEICFNEIKNPVYSDENGQTYFNHLHSDQYSQFLYWFMNSLWKISQNKIICDKTVILNKALNNLFITYKCELPPHFLFAHPTGSIIGNAGYADYLVVSQNVTINTGNDAIPSERKSWSTPILGKGLYLCAGAKIIGNKKIGNMVTVGVDAVIHNSEIKDNKIVYRNEHGEMVVKNNKNFAQNNYWRNGVVM